MTTSWTPSWSITRGARTAVADARGAHRRAALRCSSLADFPAPSSQLAGATELLPSRAGNWRGELVDGSSAPRGVYCLLGPTWHAHRRGESARRRAAANPRRDGPVAI